MALIKPQVYSQLVREKVKGKVTIMNLAYDLGDIPEFSQQGETIVFPKWKLIGDATEIVKGVAMVPEELAQDSSTAKIKQIGKPVRIFDVDAVTGLGNQIDEAGSQTALKIARKLDDDLIIEAKTTPLKSAVASGTAITSAEIESALQFYGDEIDTEEFAGIVINSRLVKSVMAMPEFTDKNKVTVSEGNGVVRKGLIGYYRLIPIYVSDKGTWDSALNECITFIVKKNSLGYKLKKGLFVEESREALLKATDIVADMMYAVKLTNDAGVVMLKKTLA